MSYNKRTWANGNVVGAVDLNRIENGIADIDVDEIRGWSVQNTQLFSETVTTVDDGYGYISAELTYSQQITAKTVTVTFNGVDYVVPRGETEYGPFYGEDDDGAVFTTYPFFIFTASDGYNSLQTETAGTYTVTVTAHDYQLSPDFDSAVNSAVAIPDTSTVPFRCESGETTSDDISDAIANGRIVYFYFAVPGQPVKIFYVTSFKTNFGSAPTFTFIPEDSSISVTFDSDGVFTISLT